MYNLSGKVEKILKKNYFLSMFGKDVISDTNHTTLPFEIFQNAALHSKSDAGIFVCGQFYPNIDRLDFTISDAGIGIRENVRKYTKINVGSCKAIEWVITEGNTTKRGSQPGGLGLKLIKDFIQLNNGKLQIVSSFGYYAFNTEGDFCSKMDYSFPGTCVNIEINTSDTNSYRLKSDTSDKIYFK